MDLHSTTFWEKNPLLTQQMPPRIGSLPKEVSDYLDQKFGSPFFHFHILDSLIKASKQKLKFIRGVVIIDVCFSKKIIPHMLKLFEEKEIRDFKKFLENLSLWLTEQVAAQLAHEKVVRYPAVYVRCVEEGLIDTKNVQIVKPRELSAIFKWILTLLGFSEPVSGFYFIFPRSSFSRKISILIKTPLLLDEIKKIDFDTSEGPFGRKNIIALGEFTIDGICPLVADNHVDFSIVRGGVDDLYYVWIKHLGIHETWLVNERFIDNKHVEGWQLVAENSWALVESGTHIVLGQVVEVDVNNVNKNIILPGTMVFTLDY